MEGMGEESGNSNEAQPDRDDEYPLLPPDPERPDYKPVATPLDLNELLEAKEKEAARFQFSLAELLMLVAGTSLVLGILGCFPPEYAAFLAGAGALVSMVVLAVLRPSRPIVYLGWWVILGIYLLMCVMAFVPGPEPPGP
jgi:hypothetical protein